MFKLLNFIFLIQFAHWSIVRGADPAAYTSAVKTKVETKMKVPGTAADADLSGTSNCANGKTTAEICTTALKGVLTADDISEAEMKLTAGAANYFLTQALLEKTTAITDNLAGYCALLEKVNKCYKTQVPAMCTDPTQKTAAEAIINQDFATLSILYNWQRFCTAAGGKNTFADKFLAASNNYATCIADTEGAKVKTAIDNALTGVRSLTVVKDEIIAFVADPSGANKKKQEFVYNCHKYLAAYNQALTTLFGLTLGATACPTETQALMFENIRAEIIPGIDLACTLIDPSNGLPTARPNPQDTTKKDLGILSFQHVLYALRSDAKYVSCKDVAMLTDVLLLDYMGNKIEGDFKNDVTGAAGFPLLEKVKVTIKGTGATTGVLTLNNDAADFPTVFTISAGNSATFEKATLVVNNAGATAKNAKITDLTTGFVIYIDKVVVGAQPIFAVTVRGPKSVFDYLGGGMMYVGCLIKNDATELADGTLAAIGTYDESKLPGSNAVVTAVNAVNALLNPTTTTASSDSYYLQANLSFILITVTIVKMWMM